MSFGNYIRSLLTIMISSFVVLALLAALVIVFVGETSMTLEIGLELDMIDAAWVLFGLPTIAVAVFLTVSPISFQVYRLLRCWPLLFAEKVVKPN
jgi:hypothetical protein